MDAEFGKYSKAEIAQWFDDEAIAWAPVQTLAEVAKDPQVKAAGGITQVPSASGDGSSFASPASPIRFPGTDDGPKGASPKMGQHSEAVLSAIGYDGDAIKALFDAGVIA
jgi:crotonobetainyl-CoA:carnitine CoA-transferase CaiB-like acyl-CoA transferase